MYLRTARLVPILQATVDRSVARLLLHAEAKVRSASADIDGAATLDSAAIRDLRDALYPEGGNSKFATVQKLLARLAAKGLVERHKDDMRAERGSSVFFDALSDLRFAFRSLGHRPGLTAAACTRKSSRCVLLLKTAGELVTLDGALDATFTATAIAG